MKKTLKIIALLTVLVISGAAFAEIEPAKKLLQFDPTSWYSGEGEVIKISNETNKPKTVFIVVRSGVSGNSQPLTGIIIQNCGQTTEVKAGSSVVCMLSTTTPITFSADKAGKMAQGTYQIDQA